MTDYTAEIQAVLTGAAPGAVLQGDCMAVLPMLPPGSVHCCVTSPPYFNLRSYLPKGHTLKPLEIGAEPTPEGFIDAMVRVFRRVRRVLREDGLLFLNLGDSYGSGEVGRHDFIDGPKSSKRTRCSFATRENSGISGNGHLLNIPHRVAEALRADGWLWRQTIIWAKAAPMPESVNGWCWQRCRVKVRSSRRATTGYHANAYESPQSAFTTSGTGQADWANCPGCPRCKPNGGYVLRKGSGRCTTAHEYVFVMAKGPGYFWDSEASAEPAARAGRRCNDTVGGISWAARNQHDRGGVVDNVDDKNPRTVWWLSPEPTIEAHFATFPSELVRRCLLAGIGRGGVCGACGAPYAPVIDTERVATRPGAQSKVGLRGEYMGNGRAQFCLPDEPGRRDPERHITKTHCSGYRPTCGCMESYDTGGQNPDGSWVASRRIPNRAKAIVLDPFSGAGTTAQTARCLGAAYIGIELNPAYVALAKVNIKKPARWWLREKGVKIETPGADYPPLING